MSRTITALFDTREDAEDGKARLKLANCDVSRVHIHDQSSMPAEGYSTHQDRGLWSSSNAFLPDEDRHTYEEGVRRGGYLLTAEVDEDDVDGAVRALEDTRGVDLDERASSWRSEGWTGSASKGAFFGGDRDRTGQNRTISGDAVAEEHIPIVEEHLVVGKREVERGGVRVRSYVAEKPVHEQVRLRDEHVSVERRPVEGRGAVDADAFRERTIDMEERDEEAVVAKEARVVEELVVRKTAEENVEQIDDTVRRTEVDVEQLGDTNRSTDRDRRP